MPQTVHENRLSDDLRHLLVAHPGEAVTIGEIERTLRGRGLVLIVMLMAAPFLSPVSIPGLSVPFGVVIAMIGFRLSLGLSPWLPERVLSRVVPRETLEKVVNAAVKVFSRVERVLAPRWEFVFAPGLRSLVGAGICLAACLLSIPVPPPIPLTNTLPAIAIILLAAGWMERDGVVVLVGYAALVGTVVYFIVLSSLILKALTEALEVVRGWWA